jgi:hypothetical protein
MSCCSDCRQGRKVCPTPEACELPHQSDDPLRDLAVVLVLIVVVGIAIVLL